MDNETLTVESHNKNRQIFVVQSLYLAIVREFADNQCAIIIVMGFSMQDKDFLIRPGRASKQGSDLGRVATGKNDAIFPCRFLAGKK